VIQGAEYTSKELLLFIAQTWTRLTPQLKEKVHLLSYQKQGLARRGGAGTKENTAGGQPVLLREDPSQTPNQNKKQGLFFILHLN
jgi:hypothetical protein